MIYVIADIHGSVSRYRDVMLFMPKLEKDDFVIIAGDAGIMYGSYVMGSLRTCMAHEDCTFIVMRGNHDSRYWDIARSNRDKWVIDEENGFAYEKKYPNIKYVKDSGGVYTIDGKDILFVPGGYSVDKYYRLESGYPFEPREELTVEEADALLREAETKHFDYIVSHAAPYSLRPRIEDLFLGYVDQSSVSLFTEKMLDEIYCECSWKEWLFGHYHADRYFDDINMTMLYNKYGVIGDELPV